MKRDSVSTYMHRRRGTPSLCTQLYPFWVSGNRSCFICFSNWEKTIWNMKILRKIKKEIETIQLRTKFEAEMRSLLDNYFASQIPGNTGGLDL